MDLSFEQSDISEATETMIDGVPALVIDGQIYYTKETMRELINTKEEES